jgi:elongation factor P
MFTYNDLRKGARFVMDGQPYEVLDFQQMYKAQDMVTAKTKIKNLITGKITEKSFHQDDNFEEADMGKVDVKFIYRHRGKYIFTAADNPSKRFELTEEQVGHNAKFFNPNQILAGIKFEGNIISISLPIKINLKVTEAAPGFKGDSAQGGTKSVVVETGADINVPLFINEGDIVEVNTETGEYVRRVEKE